MHQIYAAKHIMDFTAAISRFKSVWFFESGLCDTNLDASVISRKTFHAKFEGQPFLRNRQHQWTAAVEYISYWGNTYC